MAKPTEIIEVWKPKDEKLATASEAMDQLGYNKRWGNSKRTTDQAGPFEITAIAALGLPKSEARIAVLSAIAANSKVDSWPVAAIAIESNNPELLQDVDSVFPLDLREWRLCASAALKARTCSLAWLIERGCALSDSNGVGALSLMTYKRITNNSNDASKQHEETLALMSTPQVIASMSNDAKVAALDAMGKNLIETLTPLYASESRTFMARGSMMAFGTLWNSMEPQLRSKARRGVDAMFLAKLDLDGRYGEGADAQACLVPKKEKYHPESDYQKKKEKAWRQILPVARELRDMSLNVDWAQMEDTLQKDGYSLVSTVMRWANNAPDKHDRNLPIYRDDDGLNEPSFSLDKAFKRAEQSIGRPFKMSANMFVDDEGAGSKQGPEGLGRWMMAEWPGSALCNHLKIRDLQIDDSLPLKEDIRTRIDAYAKDAKAWADGKELPTSKELEDLDRRVKKSLKNFVLRGFERELCQWHIFAPNDDFASQINRLANDWGSTEINGDDFRRTMASWADKLALVQIALDASAKEPASTAAKKTRRV